MKKVFQVGLVWALVVSVYIVLAGIAKVHTGISQEAVAVVTASANMSNQGNVWLTQAFNIWPVVMWFIPGGVGLVATVIYLRGTGRPGER